MSKPTFICPGCNTPNRTLRDLLTCCPTELRAVTEALDNEAKTALSTNVLLRDLLTGRQKKRIELFLSRRHEHAA